MATSLQTFFLLSLVIAGAICETKWGCNKDEAISKFKTKRVDKDWPSFKENPYLDNRRTPKIDKKSVCALKYTDDSKNTYSLQDFTDAEAAIKSGYFVTHQGLCGACSNLHDLAVYLSQDLTKSVSNCASKISSDQCLKDIGFTPSCYYMWKSAFDISYNECYWPCLMSWWNNEPNNKPDGSLNACLQCSEDVAAPVFNYYAGRNTENSGIETAVKFPEEDMYRIDHCYH